MRQTTNNGFSLVELLVVMAIICVTMTVGSMCVVYMDSTRPARNAAEEITGLIRSARALAVAQNTYIVMGLRNVVHEDQPSVEIGTYYSLEGLEPASEDTGTALAVKGKLRRFKSVQIQSRPEAVDSALLASIPVAENPVGLTENTFKAPGQQGNFQWRLLITPSGEISLKDADTLVNTAIIGLSNTRSKTDQIPPASTAIVVRGAVGQATAIQP